MPQPLRSKLRRALVLALAPAAGLVACRSSDGSPAATSKAPSIDASLDASLDATSEDADDDAGPDCVAIPVEAGMFGEDGACGHFVLAPCGLPANLRMVSGCSPDPDFCGNTCPHADFFTCQLPAPTCVDGGLVPDAAAYLDCAICIGDIGRRPAGVAGPTQGRGGSPLARYLALAAALEHCSIEAFVQLGARLDTFGGPPSMRRRALRAADDERRHARATRRLARRHGGEVPTQPRAPFAPLSFEAFVTENAVEGCVRETFGALLAMHQRARAADPGVQRAMQTIALDETHHAELAWAIHRWALPRLSAAARRRVRRAQDAALAELHASTGRWHPEVVEAAGMPSPSAEARLIAEFEAAVLPPAPSRRKHRLVAS